MSCQTGHSQRKLSGALEQNKAAIVSFNLLQQKKVSRVSLLNDRPLNLTKVDNTNIATELGKPHTEVQLNA